jgi:hypothetical protein
MKDRRCPEGSPTVSPRPRALRRRALAAMRAAFDVFLGNCPSSARVAMKRRHQHARSRHASQQAAHISLPKRNPTNTGVKIPSKAGTSSS